jgi:Domain of unknown function (DUF4410)
LKLNRVATCVFAIIVLAGCASTTVTDRQRYEGERIARPDRIIVHDFATTAADVPAGSATAGQYAQPSVPPTAKEIEVGRQLGAQVAKELVAEIRGMGLPAVQAAGQPAPRIGDIVIMGYFESVDSGSATKRIVLGFGSGAADLKTAVEGYLMTENGLRRLGSGDVDAAGGKAPGVAVPLVMLAASGNPIGLIVSSAAKAEGECQGGRQSTARPSGRPRRSPTSCRLHSGNRAGSNRLRRRP